MMLNSSLFTSAAQLRSSFWDHGIVYLPCWFVFFRGNGLGLLVRQCQAWRPMERLSLFFFFGGPLMLCLLSLRGILGIPDVPEFLSRLTISAWLRCGAKRADGCRWTAVLRCIFSLSSWIDPCCPVEASFPCFRVPTGPLVARGCHPALRKNQFPYVSFSRSVSAILSDRRQDQFLSMWPESVSPGCQLDF